MKFNSRAGGKKKNKDEENREKEEKMPATTWKAFRLKLAPFVTS